MFNFHPYNTYEGYKVGCDLPGKYRVALDSDAWEFGGHGRVSKIFFPLRYAYEFSVKYLVIVFFFGEK